jgi:uroporphyrinogen decarboxylase
VALLDEAAESLPDGMKLIAIVGKVFSATWQLMGFEGLSFGLVEKPDVVARLFRTVGEIQLEVVKRAVRHPAVGAIFQPDDIAYTVALMVHPDVLREHMFPWYREMGKVCREHDVPMIYHSDGDLFEVFDDLIDCGFCAVHPIEPLAMEATEVKRRVGDKLCLCGNIEVDRLSRGTPDEIRELCERKIGELAGDGGYCLGSSNSVPEYVPLENYLAMIETVVGPRR